MQPHQPQTDPRDEPGRRNRPSRVGSATGVLARLSAFLSAVYTVSSSTFGKPLETFTAACGESLSGLWLDAKDLKHVYLRGHESTTNAVATCQSIFLRTRLQTSDHELVPGALVLVASLLQQQELHLFLAADLQSGRGPTFEFSGARAYVTDVISGSCSNAMGCNADGVTRQS